MFIYSETSHIWICIVYITETLYTIFEYSQESISNIIRNGGRDITEYDILQEVPDILADLSEQNIHTCILLVSLVNQVYFVSTVEPWVPMCCESVSVKVVQYKSYIKYKMRRWVFYKERFFNQVYVLFCDYIPPQLQCSDNNYKTYHIVKQFPCFVLEGIEISSDTQHNNKQLAICSMVPVVLSGRHTRISSPLWLCVTLIFASDCSSEEKV